MIKLLITSIEIKYFCERLIYHQNNENFKRPLIFF